MGCGFIKHGLSETALSQSAPQKYRHMNTLGTNSPVDGHQTITERYIPSSEATFLFCLPKVLTNSAPGTF